MRVRLLNPVLITVESINPTTTRAEDPPGPDTEGYDDDFREPVAYFDPADAERKVTTQTTTRQFHAQVEVDREHLARYEPTGDFPEFDVVLVASIRDLTQRGYMNADGSPVIQIGDRPTKAVSRKNGKVQATWPDLVIDEWRHASWGFGDGRDLILFLCKKGEEPS